jgi:hypothetical protein
MLTEEPEETRSTQDIRMFAIEQAVRNGAGEQLIASASQIEKFVLNGSVPAK